jgi:hypothetical protein
MTGPGIFVRTVPMVMLRYGCDDETAQRYLDLRDEGYPMHQALLMAGLADPSDEAESSGGTQ